METKIFQYTAIITLVLGGIGLASAIGNSMKQMKLKRDIEEIGDEVKKNQDIEEEIVEKFSGQ